MSDDIDLSVVLPAYREAENLRVLLPELQATLAPLARCEVVVVDTSSPLDDTEAVCASQNVRYVRRSPSNVYGDAVRTGIRESRGRFIVFMDADGSHAPAFIPRLWSEAEGNDLVIASRYVAGGGSDNGLVSRAMSVTLNRVFALALGVRVHDISNSFRCYRASLVRPLELRCDNFDIVEEVVFRMAQANPSLRIRELPFRFARRHKGETKRELVKFLVSYCKTIVRLRFGSTP